MREMGHFKDMNQHYLTFIQTSSLGFFENECFGFRKKIHIMPKNKVNSSKVRTVVLLFFRTC